MVQTGHSLRWSNTYQRGWLKTFTLREDSAHHPEVLVFKAVLPAINQQVESRTREFIRRNGEPIVLRPRIVEPRDWARLVWPISHQRLFAFGEWPIEDIHPWTEHRLRRPIRGFKLIRTWWLDELVLPYMITHQRVELPDVRRRIAEIDSHLRHRLGWERLQWLHGRPVQWRRGPEAAGVLRATAAFADQCDDPIRPDL